MAIARRAASGQAIAQADPKSTHAAITTDERPRTLFRGTEEQVRAFIKNHHPWLHVNPGDDWGTQGPMPDAVLQHPDDTEEYWNGEKWVTEESIPSEPVEKAPAVEADIPAGQKAHWDGTQWVLTDDDGVPDDTGIVTEQVPV